MKTRVVLLALAFMVSGVLISQDIQHDTKTECSKKLLKKIQKKMLYLKVKDYLDEGERQVFVLTCFVKENKELEVVKISGTDEEVKAAILETLQENPVVCKNLPSGEYFTFKMVLEYRPYNWPV